jgi:hypothetical protein
MVLENLLDQLLLRHHQLQPLLRHHQLQQDLQQSKQHLLNLTDRENQFLQQDQLLQQDLQQSNLLQLDLEYLLVQQNQWNLEYPEVLEDH